MVSDRAALLQLLRELKLREYQFVTVTPATHERILARDLGRPPSLRDIFGWNRCFTQHQIEPELLRLLDAADCIEQVPGEQLRTRVRVASLDANLFLHSSYPTDAADAVFFGPDTYRFANYLTAQLPRLRPPRTVVDLGAGSGAGGIVAAGLAPSAEITLIDVNPSALELAEINAQAASAPVTSVCSDGIEAKYDLIIANPPYMVDIKHRAYRDGGKLFGGEIAVRWVEDALRWLTPGGSMLLYTGAAIVDGEAPLLLEIAAMCRDAGAFVGVDDLDPDVFGDELGSSEYATVERIAAVGIQITTPDR